MCAFDIDWACDQKDSKEIYSTVWKGHKTKTEKANGDYSNKLPVRALTFNLCCVLMSPASPLLQLIVK